MNRLQAGDLKSYLAMKTPTEFPEIKLMPRTDDAELEQLRNLGEGQGIGYNLYDDADFGDSLSEFGIDTGFDAGERSQS